MSDEVKTPDELRELYAELRLCVESMEKDLEKNLEKSNSAAGRRVRASLRDLKGRAASLIREMVALDKSRKA
jgi:hypothetical protein